MIITRTPNRISLFGGGTDYPQYYREHGGVVIASSINCYNYIILRELPPFFDYNYRIRYRLNEYTKTVDEIKHPSVKACLNYFSEHSPLEIVHNADLPSMSGIGSSSSFTVGLVHALQSYRSKLLSQYELAMTAIDIEQNYIKESVGSQDQVIAAYGGLNCIRFSDPPREIEVTPLTISREKVNYLEEHLMLFFTGFIREASQIASTQLEYLPKRLNQLTTLKNITLEALIILQNSSVDQLNELATLLEMSWQIKKTLSPKISNSSIDAIYSKAKRAGALGGKLLGAGGGGFFLLYVQPEQQAQVRAALKPLIQVPIKFEYSGSQLIHYEPSELWQSTNEMEFIYDDVSAIA